METELQKWHKELIVKSTSGRRKSLERFEPKAFKKKK
jgi:hypothetical protein